MRVVATFPRLRKTLIRAMGAYKVFLWACSAVSAVMAGINAATGRTAPALIYLTAWAFFTASALMNSDLEEELRRTRFTVYWRFFSRYSPPLGGYAVLHILTGLVFITADLVQGGYSPLALMLILKGVFEHVLQGLAENLKAASFLYSEVLTGDLDRIALKDPFK
ncbi:hypothetical protein TEU_02830 [Thermococcus eurythermalis]|uniref:ABC transporter permease n=1 Tax=Thermococcus eurythermalis TaxID=1505907 RepID=A0A097QSD0_9EURY|nr:hypothetical protein [Thermococcus eurythermalis]AIU69364.1 hypothetical protein TEU_02830 [Thermococcus eurythermalis]